MSDNIPYLFCRYGLFIDDRPLDTAGQYDTLCELRGKMFPHRKGSDPSPDDADSCLMMPRKWIQNKRIILSWKVGQQLLQRTKSSYIRDADSIKISVEDTDEMRYTTFVGVPILGVLAVSDQVGEHWLGAKAGVSRFGSCFKNVPGGKAEIELAGDARDFHRALETWDLDQFSFSVRPFNPHPAQMGRRLHEMMEEDGIGALRGVAVPRQNTKMHAAGGGFINEAVGLAEAGYGQVGARGTTPGYKANISKPAFSGDRKKDQHQQAKPRVLKVYVPSSDVESEHEAEVAKALLEFYESD